MTTRNAATKITTFAELSTGWQQAKRENDRRAIWRTLRRGGWRRVCQSAVQHGDEQTLERWLAAQDPETQDIVAYDDGGPAAAQMVRIHLRCGLAACRNQREVLSKPWNLVLEDFVKDASIGFCTDLIRDLMGESLRAAERSRADHTTGRLGQGRGHCDHSHIRAGPGGQREFLSNS